MSKDGEQPRLRQREHARLARKEPNRTLDLRVGCQPDCLAQAMFALFPQSVEMDPFLTVLVSKSKGHTVGLYSV